MSGIPSNRSEILSKKLGDYDSFVFNDSITNYDLSRRNSISIISTPSRSLVSVSPRNTPRRRSHKTEG